MRQMRVTSNASLFLSLYIISATYASHLTFAAATNCERAVCASCRVPIGTRYGANKSGPSITEYVAPSR